jgi:hypothetical protein
LREVLAQLYELRLKMHALRGDMPLETWIHLWAHCCFSELACCVEIGIDESHLRPLIESFLDHRERYAGPKTVHVRH